MLYLKSALVVDEYDRVVIKLEHIRLDRAMKELIKINEFKGGSSLKGIWKFLDEDFKKLLEVE